MVWAAQLGKTQAIKTLRIKVDNERLQLNVTFLEIIQPPLHGGEPSLLKPCLHQYSKL